MARVLGEEDEVAVPAELEGRPSLQWPRYTGSEAIEEPGAEVVEVSGA